MHPLKSLEVVELTSLCFKQEQENKAKTNLYQSKLALSENPVRGVLKVID